MKKETSIKLFENKKYILFGTEKRKKLPKKED
jgi:hypothetical protein